MEVSTNGNLKHYNNPFLKQSPERDYWLGWIFADGCIVHDAKHDYVYLACLDLDILLKFKEFCGDRAKLNKFKYITPKSKQERIMYKIVINSQELVTYFSNTFNICGKKSNTLNPPIELNWNLMRGLYDGDGSFKKGVVLTTGSELFKNKICRFYEDNNLHYTVTKDSAYRIAIYKKADIIKVYHFLYDNSTVYLERKRIDLDRLAKK